MDTIYIKQYICLLGFFPQHSATLSATTIEWHLTLFPLSFSLSCLCFLLLLCLFLSPPCTDCTHLFRESFPCSCYHLFPCVSFMQGLIDRHVMCWPTWSIPIRDTVPQFLHRRCETIHLQTITRVKQSMLYNWPDGNKALTASGIMITQDRIVSYRTLLVWSNRYGCVLD